MTSATETEKLARLNELGRTRFVCRYGIIGWGVPTAILFALIQGYLDGWDQFVPQLIPALFLFPFAGIFWGHYIWMSLQKKHAKSASVRLNK